MRRAVLIPAVVAAVLAGAGVFAVHVQESGTAAESKRMAAIADQFPADPGWPRNPDHFNGDGYFCSPDSGCASMQRRWTSAPGLTAEDLQARIDAAGWDMKLEGDCVRTPEMSGSRSLCGAEGFIEGYEATLDLVSGSSTRPAGELVLNMH